MLKRNLQILCRTTNSIVRDYTTVTTGKWDLLAAVCIERKPVITPLMSELQEKFKNYLAQVEFERSHKSDHEVWHETDLLQAELLKKGDLDVEAGLKQTAQDFLDANIEELKAFKKNNRLTAADKKNDLKSLNRCLDKSLVLLVKQKLGDNSYYLMPQDVRKEGETLRQTADRIVKESLGDEIKVKIYGNAPAGFYKYRYPKNVRKEKGAIGAKLFIYFARYNSGAPPSKEIDYKWLNRNELSKELLPEYHCSLSQFLIDEN